MHITAVHTHYQRRADLGGWRPRLWQVAVAVHTDTGIVGFGVGGGGEAAVTVIEGHLGPLLIGREVSGAADIAAIWDDLFAAATPYGRRGVAVMALSGLDLALWDALARRQDTSVHQLLADGAARAVAPSLQPRLAGPVPTYATTAEVAWALERGHRHVKIPANAVSQPTDAQVAAAVEAARQLLDGGGGDRLMVDVYLAWDAERCRNLAQVLRDAEVYWLEDALLPDQLGELAALRPALAPVRTAGGEHEFTHYGFAEAARHQALAIWQPDITWCGGLTAGLRIAALAAEHGAELVPHRGGEPWGLALTAAGLTEPLAECVIGGPRADAWAALSDAWEGVATPRDGAIAAVEAPGFGATPRALAANL